MSQPSIVVAGLGKRYRLGANKERYKSLRDSLVSSTRGLAGRLRSGFRARRPPREHVWALRDVSFEIKRGEVVGIIGRNGAGKSTVLKVLSRITDPTEGTVDLWGRVGSLLEVGTGFHPELTGRENIFLSGAILGMTRRDMIRRFDEMVAFAEVEKFVDTPVKHYSSGMYLRLAFAVAAHLEPEILLVDEVLAVGDARFQRKCLDKMQAVGAEGRTVLFVSHSMPAITRLCPRAILLADGRVGRDGPAADVVAHYLHSGLGTTAAREWPDPARAPGHDAVRLRAVRVRNRHGEIVDTIDIREPVAIELEYDVIREGAILFPQFSVHTGQGLFAFVANDQDPAWRSRPRPVGRYVTTGRIPGNFLSEGMMLIGPAVRTLEPDVLQFWERDAVAFQVLDAPNADTARGDYPAGIPGAIRPLLEWTTEELEMVDASAPIPEAVGEP
ncbi:MAG: ATP-binding cassette domain-containing protein [Acidobacteria bacterium]|nr:ATP-binding cassette domain-containing protein [Acidobacteriota bacterium]